MKIVVIGGTGLIGSVVVNHLTAEGHDAVAAAPNTGVDTLTGEGLAAVLEGASVVVDVSNSPSFEDQPVLDFFETSTRNIVAAMTAAGVGHLVALSVVGSERLPDSGYLRAKVAQEKLIGTSGVPYSIVHATQFFEFIGRIADEATVDGVVRLPSVLFQPGAAADVSAFVAGVAAEPPLMGTVEIGGPEQFRFDELVRKHLGAHGDGRTVVADPHARYFNTELDERSLVPGEDAHLLPTTYEEWARRSAAK
jgi:uncharacterized protein YbjT (DUF2867 family)